MITITGSGGVKVEALLDSIVITDSDLKSLSLGASVSAATVEANQVADVNAIVGQNAQISGGSGGITIDADHDGVTYVDATAFGAALGVTVVVVRAVANHNATVKTRVGANAILTATGGATITINADHNDDYVGPANPADRLFGIEGAGATANKSSFALIGAVSDSETKAWAKLVVETTVEAGATLSTPGGDDQRHRRGRNVARASLKSVSAALVRIDTGKAAPVAEGTTTVNFHGNVGTIGTAGAATLFIQASGFTNAFGSMNASGGGLVSVGTGDAKATASPTLTVSFGSASTVINVSGAITVIGTQGTDADSTAKSTTGGFVEVNDYDATSTATPTVTINVNDTTSVRAGTTLTIHAINGATTAQFSDGTVLNVDGANGVSGNAITFTVNGQSMSFQHGLADGSTITYDGSCCSLDDGRTYGVLVLDPNTIQLGARFEGVQVDPATDIISFGTVGQKITGTDAEGDNIYSPAFIPTVHNLESGDFVYYFSESGSGVSGLTSGSRYRVTVVDAYRIRLLHESQAQTTISVNGASGVDQTNDEIEFTDHGFENGQPIVYYAPIDIEFRGGYVEIAINGAAARSRHGGPGGDRRRQGVQRHALPRPDPGNTVRSATATRPATRSSTTSRSAGRRQRAAPGDHYCVIRVDDYRVQLADTYCKASSPPPRPPAA